jgi:hypothetical protein
MKAWDVSLQVGDEKELESSSSKLYFSVRIKMRARKAFERLYKSVPNDVIVAIVDYWHSDVESKLVELTLVSSSILTISILTPLVNCL